MLRDGKSWLHFMTVTRFPRAPQAAAVASEASFLVNVDAGTVISTGALAGPLLGWDTAQPGGHLLDAAMPVVARLRTFVSSGRDGTAAPEPLVVWGRRGAF